MTDLNWDDLRILLAVAETGSLSAAASALRLSQPTIGRRIRALEHSLGVALVHRVSNRLELTAIGTRVIAKADTMTAVAQAVADEAWLAASHQDDPLHITATGSVSLFLVDHLAELQSGIGDIPLLLTAAKERANLQRRDADIALRMRQLPVDGNLLARKLARLAFSIYATSPGPTADRLIGQSKTDRKPSQSAFFDDWAGDRPIDLRVDDVSQRYRAVCAGGATLLPCWLGDATPDLQRQMPPPAILQEDLYLLVHRTLKPDRRVRTVAAALQRLFKTHAARLCGRADDGPSNRR
jgi:DNA-binding transcriptional LysR family regulator